MTAKPCSPYCKTCAQPMPEPEPDPTHSGWWLVAAAVVLVALGLGR